MQEWRVSRRVWETKWTCVGINFCSSCPELNGAACRWLWFLQQAGSVGAVGLCISYTCGLWWGGAEVVSLSDSWTLSTSPLFLKAQCSISLEDSITLPEEAWFGQSGASDLPAGLQFLALPPTVLWKHNPTFPHLVFISSSMVHRMLYIFLLHTLITSLVALFLSCHFVFCSSEDVVAVRNKKKIQMLRCFYSLLVMIVKKGKKKPHDTSDMMRISHMVYDAYR